MSIQILFLSYSIQPFPESTLPPLPPFLVIINKVKLSHSLDQWIGLVQQREVQGAHYLPPRFWVLFYFISFRGPSFCLFGWLEHTRSTSHSALRADVLTVYSVHGTPTLQVLHSFPVHCHYQFWRSVWRWWWWWCWLGRPVCGSTFLRFSSSSSGL